VKPIQEIENERHQDHEDDEAEAARHALPPLRRPNRSTLRFVSEQVIPTEASDTGLTPVSITRTTLKAAPNI
jgi:hypothetical protein